MNDALGNVGQTVVYTPAPEAVPSEQLADLRALVSDMDAGRVQLLVILGESNPVLTAPADLNFGEALQQGGDARPLGPLPRRDRRCSATGTCPRRTTSRPGATPATFDGTATIVQPLIQPLYGGKSAHEIVATMSEMPDRSGLRPRSRVLDGAAAGQRRGRRVREGVARLAARRHDPGHGARAGGGDAGRGLRVAAGGGARRSPAWK